MGGFENNGLSAQFWNAVPAAQISDYSNTALRIMFSRNISTFDDYDKKLSSTFIFCLHIYAQGSINSVVSDKSCEIVELSYSYVREDLINTSNAFQLTTSSILAIILLMLFLIMS